MDWKLSKEAEEMKQKRAKDEEVETSPFGGSDGFWYDITDGGYFNPALALVDEGQISAVQEAVKLLKDLESNVYQKIVPEF
jgi:soluble cytochrome b562